MELIIVVDHNQLQTMAYITVCCLFDKSTVFGLSSALPPIVDGVVDWGESQLVRLICCQNILTASSPGSR